mmetsp:Transcript_21180/g.42608  ORF Transcript_21180/g.42608 Transcript_21180/m.42608 type:complete len:459 (+) Transcript_21180:57-1433(+)|eukprot:CAMPEP_0167807526 /NCGR_PEP_ID=MMETSP0111_2-20121227/22600_1 /TAXON_ID=91324 /ORGANISM="Lotharella globosa, Strain CCCM811" /LENGTH=458 /DNA_ID=CAMNT_0007705435 /DNA_START=54 /DNA_END=1430 /DNA_ORIENTATION=+
MEALDTKQKQMLQDYQTVVDSSDITKSIQILKDCKWNLENAINTAFEMKLGGASRPTPMSTETPAPASTGPTQRRTASNGGSPTESASGLMSGNEAESPSGSRSLPGAPEEWVPQNTLIASGLSFLGPVAHRVLPHWASESQNIAPRAFAQQLKRQYPDLPNFYEGSYHEANRAARTQGRSLFLYIHSPQHEDTDDFLSQTLSNEAVRETLNGNFVCWAGSVTQTETYRLASHLRVEGYPCVAVKNPHREASRIPVPLHEGLIPAEQMVNWLHEVKVKYDADIAEAKRRNVEVKQSSQLREMQDMEYLQALEMDRQREEEERRKKELAAVEEMEAIKRKEEAEKKRIEEEKAREEEKKKKLEKRKVLAPEPPAGPGVTLVVIRLPDGQQIKRRFGESTTFQTLFDLIDTYELKTLDGDDIENWVVLSRYPKKKWDNPSMTLKDARLGRQAMFFVQEEI